MTKTLSGYRALYKASHNNGLTLRQTTNLLRAMQGLPNRPPENTYHTLTGPRNSQTGEFKVTLFKNDKKTATYYTDDKQDATSTGIEMIKHAKKVSASKYAKQRIIL